MKLIKALKASLVMPAELPAASVLDTEVGFTDDEKHALWAELMQWARQHKVAAINSAIWRRKNLETPVERPWLTARQIYDLVLVVGKQLEPGFVIDEWLEPVLEQVAYYFAQDSTFETYGEGFSLSKGILLHGPIGCGKTLLFEIIAQLDPRFSYRVESSEEIALKYKASGEGVLFPYMRAVTVCFDDIGYEEHKARNYGNTSNPMADILYARHRLRPRPITHATTNENDVRLAAMYGERVWDRFTELFNIIEFDPNTPSRRK